MEKMRIDKWLWCVRLFKTRTMSTDACRAGKIRIADSNVKPSQLVSRGTMVQIKKDGFNLLFKIVDLVGNRVGAPIAQQCYLNLTPEEEMNKYKEWFVGKAGVEWRDRGTGRPTKRERRDLDDFKDNFFLEDDDIE